MSNNSLNTKETSLGPELTQIEDRIWEIDLSSLRIFFGLSILARTLGEEINDKISSSPGDISIVHKINPTLNHELVDMHITHVQIYARNGVFKDWILFREKFQDDLRSVLGTFQRQSLARKIHPEFYGESPREQTSVALFFPFLDKQGTPLVPYQILMERVTSTQDISDFFIRISIEATDGGVLNLEKIPHEIIQDYESRHYIAGSSKISESLNNTITTLAKKGDDFFEEENSHFSKIFEQLEKTALGRLSHIHFFWDETFADLLLSSVPSQSLPIFKKLFLLLEDTTITKLLRSGATIQAKLGKAVVFVDLSRLDRIINFSFNKKRKLFDSQFYLDRMPSVKALAEKKNHSLDFSQIHVFLIHHITSEIVSMIECLRQLKVKSLDVSFVKYGGNIPPVYLDILLDIPTDQFFMAGLELKVTKERRAYYGVSPLYSDFSKHSEFSKKLEAKQLGFFEAMRELASYLFLNKVFSLGDGNEKIILIEDGGYVAPWFNQLSLEGKSLVEVCEQWQLPCPEDLKNLSFASFLKERVIGTVEHTRNGFDRLNKTAQDLGGLLLPAFSIAISDNKAKEESKEVAHSILNAIENTLHGLGKVLSQRKVLLLGSRGNIGSFLKQYLLQGRLHESKASILEVDLKLKDSKEQNAYAQCKQIPISDWADIDLIIGVTGASILTKEFFLRWIENSKNENLFLASGSTKTIEFQDFISWLNEELLSSDKKLGSVPLQIRVERIIDPQTQMDLGAKIQMIWKSGSNQKSKNVFLISDGSPVNFLFYGVPTESMDPIIAQLISASLGMVKHWAKNTMPLPKLYAVDHEIDEWGNQR